MNNHNPAQSSIAPALNVIGICMLLVGILTAVYLYQSFAVTLLEKVIYGLFGFFFSLLSGVLPVASHHLGRAGHGSLAIVAWLIWFTVCFAIGTQTHLGFMANSQAHYEQETARNSLASQVAKSDLEQASKRIESLAIDESLVNESKAQIEQIEQAINAVVGSYSGYMTYSNGVCTPKADSRGVQFKSRASEACAQIQPLLADLDKHNAVVTQFNQYQTALTAKQQALSAMQSASVISNTNETVHPLFITQARLMSFNPSLMQSFFLAFSAVAYEVLTAFVLLLGSKLSVATYQNTRAGYQVNTQPQYQQLPRHEDNDEVELSLPVDEKKSNANAEARVEAGVKDYASVEASVKDYAGVEAGVKEYTRTIVEGVEFVPSELSGIASKGRVGKKDHCVECDDEFLVKAHNQVRCPTCSEKARVSYRGTLKRKDSI
ncbi:hypothetical protein [Beggiatoa leptomitoformis]|uniref:hypothetical protein n=1 Tax=Beggiatoa leptomitoformis TaxID=288004 RepID=UPI0007067AF0|nr:hypothetical protein [Beggiatoa leptomitoformis]